MTTDKPPEPTNDYERRMYPLVNWVQCSCGTWMDGYYLRFHREEYKCLEGTT
jgi:hypothetical protein